MSTPSDDVIRLFDDISAEHDRQLTKHRELTVAMENFMASKPNPHEKAAVGLRFLQYFNHLEMTSAIAGDVQDTMFATLTKLRDFVGGKMHIEAPPKG